MMKSTIMTFSGVGFRQVSRTITRLASAVALSVLITGCAGTLHVRPFHAGSPHLGRSAYVPTAVDGRILAQSVLRALGDSITDTAATSLWDLYNAILPSTSDTSFDFLTGAFALLERRGCSVFMLKPDTYEAFHAAVSFPAIPFLAVVRFAHKAVIPFDREALLAQTGILDSCSRALAIKPVIAVSVKGDRYELIAGAGEILEGLAGDRMTGTVYPVKDAAGQDTYAQVAGVFLVSRFPMGTVQAHLDEWFEAMPSSAGRPEAVRAFGRRRSR